MEDTDQSRLVPGAAENLEKLLGWAGIEPDESPIQCVARFFLSMCSLIDRGGPYGPYTQSQRLGLYSKYTDQLLESGAAYRCFCSRERLDKVRRVARAAGHNTPYDGYCRHLSNTELSDQLQSKTPYVVRLKVPHGTQTSFEDTVFGTVKFSSDNIDDQVLVKSDGFPTYHLANVVDDNLMDISHVLRGEEWLSSTPKHVILYEALGLKVPHFVHLPLLLNPDRTKLSKRQEALNVQVLRDRGYLPQSVTNFCALLGWTATDDQELFDSLDELASAFEPSRIHKAGAVVDWNKLDWMHRHHMRSLQTGASDTLEQVAILKKCVAKDFPQVAETCIDDQYLQEVVLACQKTFAKVWFFVFTSH